MQYIDMLSDECIIYTERCIGEKFILNNFECNSCLYIIFQKNYSYSILILPRKNVNDKKIIPRTDRQATKNDGLL